MKSQNTRLLEALEHHSLTAHQLDRSGGISRAAARVCELRQQGHAIVTTMVKVRNRYGQACHVARYSL